MHKQIIVNLAWVKNVYNHLLPVNNSWKTSALASTYSLVSRFIPNQVVYESQVVHQFIQSLFTYFYTPLVAISPQLNTSFTHFPQDLLLLQSKRKGEK